MNEARAVLALYEDAEFYDWEFAERDREVPLFRRLAREAAGPVLEVGCGTGRLTLPIAADGVDITGLDLSAPMLARARAKARDAGLRVDWVEGDCRCLAPAPDYALIFSATNAMQHLLDLDAALAFLTAARAALRPGGRLVVDVSNPDVAKLARPPTQRYRHKTFRTPDGAQVTVDAVSGYRDLDQVLWFHLFYEIDGVEARTKQVEMRCFFPQELSALCRLAGLRILERLGGYDGVPFGEGAAKQILICEAAGP
ncbi:MAG TPA: class I SAM-dependent methyltransferase [Phenylobacterium sp.]